MCEYENNRNHPDIDQITCHEDWVKFFNEIDEANKPKPETKQTIAVDWLTLSLVKQMPDLDQIKRMTLTNGQYNVNPDCYMVYVNSPMNGFNDAVMIYVFGKYLGKLLFNPDNGLQKNTVHLIVENSRFYTNDYVESIDYLVYNLNFTYSHLVRLDIALDFIKMSIYSFLHKFIKSPNIQKRGKAKYKPTIQGKTIVGFKIGSELSDKQISVYPKTKDLLSTPKPYIPEYWTLNGMNHIDNDVERIELRLKTKELKNIDYEQLNNVEYLLGICKLHFKDYFQFESKYRQNNKTVTKDVTPIDISFKGLSTVFLTKIVNLPKLTDRALKAQTHNKVNDILFEQLAQDNEKDLSKINPENLEYALLSLERFFNLNPEMRAYQTRKQKTWERQFKTKNAMYHTNEPTPEAIKPMEEINESLIPIIKTINEESINEVLPDHEEQLNNESLKPFIEPTPEQWNNLFNDPIIFESDNEPISKKIKPIVVINQPLKPTYETMPDIYEDEHMKELLAAYKLQLAEL